MEGPHLSHSRLPSVVPALARLQGRHYGFLDLFSIFPAWPARPDLCENRRTFEFVQDHPRGRRSERRVVSDKAETPFDSIEGSHEYVAMLAEALDEARRDVEAEIAAAERESASRRKEALLLVSYNLAKLNLHITSSRRILNDLRSLRRLLLAERGLPAAEDEKGIAAGEGA